MDSKLRRKLLRGFEPLEARRLLAADMSLHVFEDIVMADSNHTHVADEQHSIVDHDHDHVHDHELDHDHDHELDQDHDPDHDHELDSEGQLIDDVVHNHEGLMFDGTGYYYFDPAPEPAGDDGHPAEPSSISVALNVPVLHSNPTATKKIFLDFDGHDVSGTGWNQFNNGNTIHAPAYSTDGDIFNFSASEINNIEEIHGRIAEDFAPFNVDVTTEDPGTSIFNQGNMAIRVLISTDYDSAAVGGTGNRWFGGAGGVAYLNSWSWNDDTPVWVFENNLSNGNPKSVAEAASHEVGHALNLSHDGSSTSSYYSGHGSGTTSWAPIMGVGYSRNVTQWSRGEYSGADNTQNDLAIMTTNARIPYRADDHSSSITNISSATNIVPTSGDAVNAAGIIERSTDIDTFSIVVSGVATVDLDIDPFDPGPNLDISATLYDNSGNILVTNNPVNSLDASVNTTLQPGSYLLAIDGVGKGTTSNGYSDYGSLGQYVISGTITVSSAPCGNPFIVGGTSGDQHADVYYTPATGRLVLDPDGTYVRDISVEAVQPTSVDFSDPSWTYSYNGGAANWSVSAGQSGLSDVTHLATYATGLDPASDFSCNSMDYTLADDPNGSSLTQYTNVSFDSAAPTAVPNGVFTDVTTPGGSDYQFSVTYTDNVSVDLASLGDNDIRVNSSAGYSELATLVSAIPAADGSVTATYSMNSRGVAWDFSDNGTYFVSLNTNGVSDYGGNLTSSSTITTFEVDIAVTCGTPFVNSGTKNDEYVDFYYTPSTGRLVMDTDLSYMYTMIVHGPEPASNDFDALGWDYAYFNSALQWYSAPGLPLYRGISRLATMDPNLDPAVAFTCVEYAYNVADEPSGQGTIAFADVRLDSEAPTGIAAAADIVTAGGSTQTVTVTFTDNVGVDETTFTNGDVVVSGPNGYSSPATFVSATPDGQGGFDVVYEIAANGGTWDSADNGTYTISTAAGEVADLGGNVVNGSVDIGSFLVDISGNNVPHDLDGDGDVDGDDIDAMCLAASNGSTDLTFDYNSDGIVNSLDFSAYLGAINVLSGDANMDGSVDVSDLTVWIANRFVVNDPSNPGVGWATADFNCDGSTDVSDFAIWNANAFTSSPVALLDGGTSDSQGSESGRDVDSVQYLDQSTTQTVNAAVPNVQPIDRSSGRDLFTSRSSKETTEREVRTSVIDQVFGEEWN